MTDDNEALDEWLIASGGDPAVKAALETEFESVEPEREDTPDG